MSLKDSSWKFKDRVLPKEEIYSEKLGTHQADGDLDERDSYRMDDANNQEKLCQDI